MCVCVHTDQQSTIAPLLTLIQLFSLSVPTVSTSILLKRSEGGEKVTEKRLKLGFCYLKSFLLLMLKSTQQAQKLLYVCLFTFLASLLQRQVLLYEPLQHQVSCRMLGHVKLQHK